MAKTANLYARIEPDVKEQAERNRILFLEKDRETGLFLLAKKGGGDRMAGKPEEKPAALYDRILTKSNHEVIFMME